MLLQRHERFLSEREDKVSEEVSHLRKVQKCVTLAIFISAFGFSLRRPLTLNAMQYVIKNGALRNILCITAWKYGKKYFKRLDYLDNLTLSKSISINIRVKYMSRSSAKHKQVIINCAIHVLEDCK